MKRILKLIVSLSAVALLFGATAALMPTQSVFAATPQQTACEAINGSAGCTTSSNGLTNIINLVVQVMSIVIGFIAVVMIVFAGFKYVTSGGDTNKVASAKNSLMYAIIGLIIVALAQFIVRVVLAQANTVTNTTTNSTTNTTTNKSSSGGTGSQRAN